MPGVIPGSSPDAQAPERPALPQRSSSLLRPRSLALPNLANEHNRPNYPPQARQQVSNEALLIEVRDQLEDVSHKVGQIQRLLRTIHYNQEDRRSHEPQT
jgi:hypothetical protein